MMAEKKPRKPSVQRPEVSQDADIGGSLVYVTEDDEEMMLPKQTRELLGFLANDEQKQTNGYKLHGVAR
jgi:hypothetical protein